jgi:GTP-binding protein LepA
MLKYILPLNEIILDFSEKLKSATSGYASFDYEHAGYTKSSLFKLTISLNDVEIEELTQIVHADRAAQIGRQLVEKLKEEVPRELFKIAVQAKVNSKILARETIPAYRKDVTAKLVFLNVIII